MTTPVNSAARRGIRFASACAGALLPLLLVLLCSMGVGMGQAVTTVHINEVESNGGTPGDWFELINTGTSAANVSGWKMKDNDDTHAFYVFPPNTVIAPGGYLVIEEAQFGFGLGAPDSVRIFDAAGAIYETYSWTAHAGVTYGRCPNGTGDLINNNTSTKGATNDCSSPIKINEVESNLGTPGDWVELFNPSAAAVNVSGFVFKDNDDTHGYVIPPNTSIAAGGYLVLEEAAFGFGLGAADSARLFDNLGALADSYAWTEHAATTYGRCPNGSGLFTTTTASTKGAANDCSVAVSSVKFNEVESNGGTPGDWVEIYNPTTAAISLSGFVFKDNDDAHGYIIPGGTSVPAGGYFVLDEAAFGFGLGAPDSVRLFDASGKLVDSFTWTDHATTTYGLCPNGTGTFTTTTASTKGTANTCPVVLSFQPWPGGPEVQTVDGTSVFGSNLSGLIYEGTGSATPGVLWAVRNGPGSLFRMIFNGTIWTPDPTNNWGAGKLLLYPGGTGSPDSEGVTFAGNSNDGIYVSTERDNNANGISRNSILRFDPLAIGPTLTATHEWNLTADLPVTGPNLGAEAIVFIPDSYLVAGGFFDAAKNHAYNPSEYPNHGTGLFFVGLEANGNVYAFALDHSPGGKFTRIATISTGFTGVMDLQLDAALGDFWAICDDTCQGRSAILRIGATGNFTPVAGFERPAQMPNLNNEGFAITPASECVANRRPVFWSDDSETGGHSIRKGSLSCTKIVNIPDAVAPKATPTVSPAPTGTGWNSTDATVTWNWLDNPGGSGIDNTNCTITTVASNEGVSPLSATCKDLAGNTGNATFTVKVDKTVPTIVPSAKKADNTPYTFGDWSTQSVTVHYTCNDTVSLVATCTQDQIFSSDGRSSTIGLVIDNAGLRAVSPFLLIRVDQTAPTLTVTSPSLPSYPNTGLLPVAYTAIDQISGIASQSATLDGIPITTFSLAAKSLVIDLSQLSLGTHSVAVTATDVAGNTRTTSVPFTVTIAP